MSNNGNVNVTKFDLTLLDVIDTGFEKSFPELINLVENNFFKRMYAKFATNKIKKCFKEYYDKTIYRDDIDELFGKINDLLYVLASEDDDKLAKDVDVLLKSFFENELCAEEHEEEIKEYMDMDLNESIEFLDQFLVLSIYERRNAISYMDWVDKLINMIRNTDVGAKFIKILNMMVNKSFNNIKDNLKSIEEYATSEDDICKEIMAEANPYSYIDGASEDVKKDVEQSTRNKIRWGINYINNLLAYITR